MRMRSAPLVFSSLSLADDMVHHFVLRGSSLDSLAALREEPMAPLFFVLSITIKQEPRILQICTSMPWLSAAEQIRLSTAAQRKPGKSTPMLEHKKN